MFHQTGEIIKWSCAISIFVHTAWYVASWIIEFLRWGHAEKIENRSNTHPIALLKSAAVTGRQDSHLRTGVHEIRLPTWSEWVSEPKQVWQWLHHLSKEVSCHCVSAELEMPKKNCISGLWTSQVKVPKAVMQLYISRSPKWGQLGMTGSDWACK